MSWLGLCPHQRVSGGKVLSRRTKSCANRAATAHKLARLFYTMLKHGTAYVRRGMEEYEQQYRDRVVKNMARRAKALGYTPVKAPEGVPV